MRPRVIKQLLTSPLDTEIKSTAGETSPGATKQAPVAAPYDWKAFLNSLPTYSCRDANTSRRVTYFNNLDASDQAAARFSICDVIGIDAEWMPTRKRNESSRIALVQVACRDECQLHHVHGLPFFPPNLREVLEDPNILKVGVGIEQDVRKLRFDWGVEVKNYLDLSPLALEIDPFWSERAYRRGSNIALVRLAARYLKRSVDKEQQCSNWENHNLTESQLAYAANDGFVVLDVYHALIRIRQGIQSLEELDSAPTTPSSISSTSLPPYEALPPAAAPSIHQQPISASIPPRFQLIPSHPAPIPPSQAPSVLTPPPVYGYFPLPPLYQSPTQMLHYPRPAPLTQMQAPIPVHAAVYQNQPQIAPMYDSRPLTGGHRYPPLTPPHLSQNGWNLNPYEHSPPYLGGWFPGWQPPPSSAPPQYGPGIPLQYNTLNHYTPWSAFP